MRQLVKIIDVAEQHIGPFNYTDLVHGKDTHKTQALNMANKIHISKPTLIPESRLQSDCLNLARTAKVV